MLSQRIFGNVVIFRLDFAIGVLAMRLQMAIV